MMVVTMPLYKEDASQDAHNAAQEAVCAGKSRKALECAGGSSDPLPLVITCFYPETIEKLPTTNPRSNNMRAKATLFDT